MPDHLSGGLVHETSFSLARSALRSKFYWRACTSSSNQLSFRPAAHALSCAATVQLRMVPSYDASASHSSPYSHFMPEDVQILPAYISQPAPPQFETVSFRSCNTEFEEHLFGQVRLGDWQRTVPMDSRRMFCNIRSSSYKSYSHKEW